MILDCVLTAVNENKMYLDLCPIFIKTWNKLYPDVDVKIVLIAKSIPTDLLLYKDNYNFLNQFKMCQPVLSLNLLEIYILAFLTIKMV